MRELFPDWRAQGHRRSSCTSTAAASRSTSTSSTASPTRPRPRACAVGGVDGDGHRPRRRRRRHEVLTTRARSQVEQVIVGAGRGCSNLGACSACPSAIDIRTPTGDVRGTSRCGRTGTCRRARSRSTRRCSTAADGSAPPVIHVDTDAPLHDDDGKLVTDELWGIYYKRDRHGVQGGAAPLRSAPTCRSTRTRPRTSIPTFPDMWCAALRTAWSGSRAAGRCTRRALRRCRRVHGRQLPGLRLHPAERLRDRRLEPRLQDDRRRSRGREGRLRRALVAAVSVPLRALRDGRSAPGLEQPVPLELSTSARMRAPSVLGSDPGNGLSGVRPQDGTRAEGARIARLAGSVAVRARSGAHRARVDGVR